MRPSVCAGQGLFASRDIPAGQRIVEYVGERISASESAARRAAGNNYIFHLSFGWAVDGSGPGNVARYVNHSCSPNCRIEIEGGRIFVVSVRSLGEGEELSFDYGYDSDDYQRFPCNCGARNCCGYIVGREFWGQLPQWWDTRNSA